MPFPVRSGLAHPGAGAGTQGGDDPAAQGPDLEPVARDTCSCKVQQVWCGACSHPRAESEVVSLLGPCAPLSPWRRATCPLRCQGSMSALGVWLIWA